MNLTKASRIRITLLNLFVFLIGFCSIENTVQCSTNHKEVVSVVGNYWDVWGWARRVELDGKYAYITLGESDEGIQILDVSDPGNPRRVGSLPFGWIYNIDVKDNIAFCGPRFDKEVVVYDVADKAYPKLIIKLPTKDEYANPLIEGDLLLVRSGGQTQLYDVNVPRAPRLLSTLPDVTVWHVDGNRGYGLVTKIIEQTDPDDTSSEITLFKEQVVVLDMTNLLKPRIIAKRKLPMSTRPCNLIYAHRGYLYVGLPEQGIQIYNQSNLKKPIGHLRLWGDDVADDAYRGFHIVDNCAYFVNQGWGFLPNYESDYSESAGLWMLDLTDPENPVVAGRWGVYEAREAKIPMRMEFVQVHDSFAYVIDSMFGLRVLDVSNLNRPRLVGNYKAGGEMIDSYLTEKRMYVSEYLSGGITILDIAYPGKPERIGYFHSGGYIYKMAGYKDEYLYFDSVDGDFVQEFGFYVIDVRDPTSPRIAYWQQETVGPVRVEGDLLLTVSGLFSLKNPEKPAKLADWPIKGETMGSYVRRGNYVFFARARQGEREPDNFQVIDISEPNNPKVVAMLSITGDDSLKSYRFMQIVGDKVYVGAANEDTQISVVNISNPTKPKLIGEYGGLNGSDSFYGFHVQGKKLFTFHYYAGEENGIIYDISKGLERPKEVQIIPGFYTWQTEVQDNYIYAVRFNGLEIFELN
ncbi:MAG: LVIVD repeat protein [Candidatus Scalindua rubra]|uniref:LVIVD repeat protein n=1 Tax=Candidatus Scalindua rubra TaxID=1872076 RepID=A0A1E3XDG5_9BACT|nr:MAG: LVIVD repeat protein [Candidatus Scalindua rubra]